MSRLSGSDPIKVPAIPSTLAPDEAVTQLKIIVRDVINQIVAALTPFVSAGYSLALKARTEAENLLTALAVADKSTLPKYMQEMQNLLSELYMEGGAADTSSGGTPVRFPVLVDPNDLNMASALVNKGDQLIALAPTAMPAPAPAPPKPSPSPVPAPKPAPTPTPTPSQPAPQPLPTPSGRPIIKKGQPQPIDQAFELEPGTPINCPPGTQWQFFGMNGLNSVMMCKSIPPSLPSSSPPPSSPLPSPPLPSSSPSPLSPQTPLPPTISLPPSIPPQPSPPLGTLPPSPAPSPPLPPLPPSSQPLPPLSPSPSIGVNPPIPPSPSPIPPLPPLPPAVASSCPPCLTDYLKSIQGWQQTVKTALDLVLQAIQKPVNITVNEPQVKVTESNGHITLNTSSDITTFSNPTNLPPIKGPRSHVPGNLPTSLPSGPVFGTLNIPNFNSRDVCDAVANWGKQPISQQGKDLVAWLTSGAKQSGEQSVVDDLKSEAKKVPYVGSLIVAAIEAFQKQGEIFPYIASYLGNWFGKEIGCNAGDMIVPIVAESLIGMASKYVSANFDDYAIPFQQWKRAICPTQLPSVADANACFNADLITPQLWECWVRAQNALPGPAELVRAAGDARLTSGDYVSLYLRGLIDEDDLQSRLREIGYVRKGDRDGIKNLAVALPGIGDIIRFLVRDVGDTRIVSSFGLDESFANKWSEDLAKLAKSQGISDDLAKLYWRAHWDIPSPTQLYTMLHRLRPGRVPGLDPTKLKRPLTPAEQQQRLKETDLVTTLADVQLALQQDDVAPFWINRMIAMTYRALTRTDLRSAYVQSSIDATELVEGLQDFGYDLERSKVLARIYQNMKVRTILRYPEVQLYVKGTLSKEEVTIALTDEGVEQAIIDRVIRRADLRSKGLFRDKCLNQIVKAYYKGEMSDIQLRQQLHKLGLTNEHINRMLPNIQCEAAHKDKELALSQVARLYYDGLLRFADLPLRLVRIGYNIDLANLLANDLKVQKEVRDGKEQERKTRKQQAEELRKKREAEKLAKDNAKKEKAGSNLPPPAPMSP